MKPALLIIAGPNGAGKTTVTRRLMKESWSDGVEYLNPDEVAEERFGGWNSREAVQKAADWVTARREDLLAQRKGIAFETVFSTEEKVEFLRRAKAADYFTRVFFISTSDPSINAKRVLTRMMEGGHSVPIEKIRSRYERSMVNLDAAIEVADRVYLYDNSIEDEESRLVARTEGGALRKVYGEHPEWVARAIAHLERHPSFVDARSE